MYLLWKNTGKFFFFFFFIAMCLLFINCSLPIKNVNISMLLFYRDRATFTNLLFWDSRFFLLQTNVLITTSRCTLRCPIIQPGMFVAYIRMKDTLIAKYFYNGKRRKKKVIKRYTNKIHRLKSRSYNEKLKTKFFFYQAKDESFSLPILMIFLNISQRTPFWTIFPCIPNH